MKSQGIFIQNQKHYISLIGRRWFSLAFLLLLLACNQKHANAYKGEGKSLIAEKLVLFNGDTIKTKTGNLPLNKKRTGLKRPRFETVHLVLGIGGTGSDYSDLERLRVNNSNFSIPLSIYAYIPFQTTEPGFYILSGADIDLFNSEHLAFKALLLYQTPFKMLAGLGAARTTYASYGEINVEVNQTQGLLALGINLSPQRVDLLLTLPLASRLKTNFEEAEYTVKPAGLQLSLLISLR